MIEVFLESDCHAKHPPPTSRKATLKDTQPLGSSFEQIDIGAKGFYMAFDKSCEKILVMFGARLKLIYRNTSGDYVDKAMCWNIEKYSSVNPQEIPRDARPKNYEQWFLSNPHPGWPPWAEAGVYHWRIWIEQ